MKLNLDIRNEIKAIGATIMIVIAIVLVVYLMYWISMYGWAMFNGSVNKWITYSIGLVAVIIIHRIVRKKVYNPTL